MIVYKLTEKWCIEWQRVIMSETTSDNEWYNEWQRVTKSGTMRDNEWQRVVQRMKTNDSE